MLRACVAFVCLFVSSAFAAGDPVAGAQLYQAPNGAPLGCAAFACHGPDPLANISNIRNAADKPAVIQNAIDKNLGGMSFLKPYVGPADLENLAAFIANPAAGTPQPKIGLSSTSLAFGNQVVATRSGAMTLTVSNTGSAALTLANIVISGTAAAEYERAGTCSVGAAVPAGGSCTIIVSFMPQAIGARSASLVLSHDATGGSSAIALSGTGVAASGPVLSLSAATLAFSSQAVGTAGTVQTLTIANSGIADLTINGLALAGANPGDFIRGGTCAVGATLAVKSSCTVTLAFAPAAAGARAASLAITSNAPGSPHAVALSGPATQATTPVASLAPDMLLFGNHVVGVASPAQTVTLTNTGAGPLSITSATVSGAGFARTSNCGASLAPAASCTLTVTFTPAAAGLASGALALQTNAPGSPHQVQLSGNGVAAGTVLPTVMLNPATLTFAAQGINTASAPQTVTLANSGTVALAVTAITLTGAEASDFARGGTCAAPGTVAPGASCTITVTFTPTGAGTRHGALNLISNAAGSPSVALTGTGTAPPPASPPPASPAATPQAGTPAPAASGSNTGGGGCTAGPIDEFDPLWLIVLLAAGFYVLIDRRRMRRHDFPPRRMS